MIETDKKARSAEGLSQRQQIAAKILDPSVGASNSYIPEQVSVIPLSSGQKIIQGKNNACILLHRDAPAGPVSGYGAAGNTQCGAISMIVGRGSEYGYEYPDIKTSAATLYISQKSDIDKHLGLAEGDIGFSEGESCIALRADSIRLASRSGIKLVTRADEDTAKPTLGIELNAGNQSGHKMVNGKKVAALQPIPKGDNLVMYLEELSDQINVITRAVNNLITQQSVYNDALSAHFHISPVGPTTPDPILFIQNILVKQLNLSMVKPDISSNKINISSNNFNYLSPFGDLYINSSLNKTT